MNFGSNQALGEEVSSAWRILSLGTGPIFEAALVRDIESLRLVII